MPTEGEAPTLPKAPIHTSATASTDASSKTTTVNMGLSTVGGSSAMGGHVEESATVRALMDQVAKQQRVIDAMMAERNGTTAADTLRTPVSTRVHSVREYVAPAAQRALHMSSDTDLRAPSQHVVDDDDRRVGLSGMSLEKVLGLIKGYVLPFYADTVKDNGRTVAQFVRNIEVAMGNLLIDPHSPHRLMTVQMCLRDGALDWMDRKLQEMRRAEQGWRDFASRPLSWDDEVRRPFIEAHLGTNTPELWLAKMGKLKLGDDKTPTPIELDNQFDTIAGHIVPSWTAGDDSNQLLLVTQYRDMVARSNKRYLINILNMSPPPATLKRWKEALSHQFNADLQVVTAQYYLHRVERLTL